MPNEVASRDEPNGLEEAESRIRGACALLGRGDAEGMEEAGAQFQKLVQIVSAWHGDFMAGPSPRRIELHKSIQRAGRLLEAAGHWCEHRRNLLLHDETTPPCYGANGRSVVAPMAASTTLRG